MWLMDDIVDRLRSALSDRYTIERELGAGGMGPQICADRSRSPRKMPRE
jgi:hypothetical protein